MSRKITRVVDFVKVINKIKWDANCDLFFRGHDKVIKNIEPSLYGREPWKNLWEKEAEIYNDAIAHCPQEFVHCGNTIETLVKMQHYGIPTRILDVTRNALVALFFACWREPKKTGEVVIFNVPQKNILKLDSDRLLLLANLAKQRKDFKFDYSKWADELKRFDDEKYEKIDYQADKDYQAIIEEINDSKDNGKWLGSLSYHCQQDRSNFWEKIIDPRDLEKVYAVQVKLDNPRIIRQSGAFFIFGIKQKKSQCASLEDSGIEAEKIFIGKKEDLLKELNDNFDINEYTLFPELEKYVTYYKKHKLDNKKSTDGWFKPFRQHRTAPL